MKKISDVFFPSGGKTAVHALLRVTPYKTLLKTLCIRLRSCIFDGNGKNLDPKGGSTRPMHVWNDLELLA